MRKLTNIFIASIIVMFSGCGETDTEDKVTYIVCDILRMKNGECSRYVDRNIYLPRNSSTEVSVDLEFAKSNFRESLDRITENSIYLGKNYFNYIETDENLMSPITDLEVRPSEFNSFVMFWSSDRFNQYIEDNNIKPADPNAILVINKANKRQFWMIFRMECFLGGTTEQKTLCTNNESANYTTSTGAVALVARTLSRLIGEPYSDCEDDVEDYMCSLFPNDGQWSSIPKEQSNITRIDNRLELISSYYNVLSDGSIQTYWDVATIDSNLEDQN